MLLSYSSSWEVALLLLMSHSKNTFADTYYITYCLGYYLLNLPHYSLPFDCLKAQQMLWMHPLGVRTLDLVPLDAERNQMLKAPVSENHLDIMMADNWLSDGHQWHFEEAEFDCHYICAWGTWGNRHISTQSVPLYNQKIIYGASRWNWLKLTVFPSFPQEALTGHASDD